MNTDIAVQGRVAGSSFYAGMRVLPQAERHAMYAVYAFCRAVDDIADDQGGAVADRTAALEAWRADIARLYTGGAGGQAEFLRDGVEAFGLARSDFDAVIDGMAMDTAADICWPSRTVLDQYCDRVAVAVGRLSVRIFGMAEGPGDLLAHHLGRALQLTNILRDIDEDAAIGRVYLPIEALRDAGLEPVGIAELVADPRLDRAARALAADAQAHFDAAQAIMAQRPRGHIIAPRLMAGAYSELLRRMAQVGWAAPRHRVRHNRLALIWLMVRLRLKR